MSDRARNSIRGRKAQLAGATFETWVEDQHEIAKRMGILAHDHHNEPRVKFVGGKLIYEKATVADWTGTLEGGRSLAVEAKSVDGERFARDAVTVKQQEHLEVVALAGGLSLLVVEFRVDLYRARFAISWPHVPWEKRRNAEAIYLDVLKHAPGWSVSTPCYLQHWHTRGERSSPLRSKVYPSE